VVIQEGKFQPTLTEKLVKEGINSKEEIRFPSEENDEDLHEERSENSEKITENSSENQAFENSQNQNFTPNMEDNTHENDDWYRQFQN
jgi:hypothetical protein